MTKSDAEMLAEIIAKYSLAIGCCLYPSQVDSLKDALCYWKKYEAMPEIEDAFTRLAFLMIVSDLIYTKREQKGGERE